MGISNHINLYLSIIYTKKRHISGYAYFVYINIYILAWEMNCMFITDYKI